jgi:hypothetical protein
LQVLYEPPETDRNSVSSKNILKQSLCLENPSDCFKSASLPTPPKNMCDVIASAQVRIDMIAEPIFAKSHWQDLGTNLASEFISSPGHTGIMDTILCVTKEPPRRTAGLPRDPLSLGERGRVRDRLVSGGPSSLGFLTPRLRYEVCLETVPNMCHSCATFRGKWPSGRTFTRSLPHLYRFSEARAPQACPPPPAHPKRGAGFACLSSSLPHLYRFSRWFREPAPTQNHHILTTIFKFSAQP